MISPGHPPGLSRCLPRVSPPTASAPTTDFIGTSTPRAGFDGLRYSVQSFYGFRRSGYHDGQGQGAKEGAPLSEVVGASSPRSAPSLRGTSQVGHQQRDDESPSTEDLQGNSSSTSQTCARPGLAGPAGVAAVAPAALSVIGSSNSDTTLTAQRSRTPSRLPLLLCSSHYDPTARIFSLLLLLDPPARLLLARRIPLPP